MALVRITIAVPAALIRQADRTAKREGRSRSWIVVDALRRQLAERARERRGRRPTIAPQPGNDFPSTGARAAQIRAALSLTPGERLARAEDLGALARERQGRGRREQVIAFESYDDFYRWKAARRIGA